MDKQGAGGSDNTLGRRERLKALGQQQEHPVVGFWLALPDADEVPALAQRVFDEGVREVARLLARCGHKPPLGEVTDSSACYVVDAAASDLERWMAALLDGHALGCFFEIWWYADGKTRQVLPVTPALPAERQPRVPTDAMQQYFDAAYADWVAGIAVKSLVYEVNVAPKPGLVDRWNNGAHRDMDVLTFLCSGSVLGPYFCQTALIGQAFEGEPEGLLARLRYPGIQAEDTMLRATGGVNTHKGAIFSLGILSAAAGYAHSHGLDGSSEALLALCGRIAGQTPTELGRGADAGKTHGQQAFRQYGLTGIRGEAAAGYPQVRECGLPALQGVLAAGHSMNDAAVAALLHLIAHVEDTNIVRRANYDTLRAVQTQVKALLAETEDDMSLLMAKAKELDDDFIRRNLSPGGSADLLAMCLMLHFLEADKASAP